MKNLFEVHISAGRDYNTYSKYEFVVFDGDEVVARKGGFSNNASAKRAGLKAAQAYIDGEATAHAA